MLGRLAGRAMPAVSRSSLSGIAPSAAAVELSRRAEGRTDISLGQLGSTYGIGRVGLEDLGGLRFAATKATRGRAVGLGKPAPAGRKAVAVKAAPREEPVIDLDVLEATLEETAEQHERAEVAYLVMNEGLATRRRQRRKTGTEHGGVGAVSGGEDEEGALAAEGEDDDEDDEQDGEFDLEEDYDEDGDSDEDFEDDEDEIEYFDPETGEHTQGAADGELPLSAFAHGKPPRVAQTVGGEGIYTLQVDEVRRSHFLSMLHADTARL